MFFSSCYYKGRSRQELSWTLGNSTYVSFSFCSFHSLISAFIFSCTLALNPGYGSYLNKLWTTWNQTSETTKLLQYRHWQVTLRITREEIPQKTQRMESLERVEQDCQTKPVLVSIRKMKLNGLRIMKRFINSLRWSNLSNLKYSMAYKLIGPTEQLSSQYYLMDNKNEQNFRQTNSRLKWPQLAPTKMSNFNTSTKLQLDYIRLSCFSTLATNPIQFTQQED